MIQRATIEDIPALMLIVNGAYRGEESKRGWTSEADLISGGIRMEESGMKKSIERPDAVVLKYTDEENNITGCVYLQNKTAHVYLGMLSVSPTAQAQGIGRKLLKAAEDHAREQQLNIISLKVLSARTALIGWYERHGYRATGKIEPFDIDPKFGTPVQPLELLYMEKVL